MTEKRLEHEEAFPLVTRELLAVVEAAGERRALARGASRRLGRVLHGRHAGVSPPVVGLGIVLQHLSLRVALLLFVLSSRVGIVAAAPLLVRRP